MKKLKTLALLLIAGCAPLNVSAQRVINLNDQNANVSLQKRVRGSDANVELVEGFPGEIKAYRPFVINPALQSPETVAVGDTIILELFENQVYKTVVSDASTNVVLGGRFGLILNLPDDPAALIFISTSPSGESGVHMQIPKLRQRFTTRPSSDRRPYLIEADDSKQPQVGDVTVRTFTAPPAIEESAYGRVIMPEPVLLMLYTPEAEKQAGNIYSDGIDGVIRLSEGYFTVTKVFFLSGKNQVFILHRALPCAGLYKAFSLSTNEILTRDSH